MEGRNTPTALKVLARHSVSEMCLGPTHSSVLMDSGHLYTFGDNRYGQLGHGNLKSVESPACVKSLVGKHVTVCIDQSLRNPIHSPLRHVWTILFQARFPLGIIFLRLEMDSFFCNLHIRFPIRRKRKLTNFYFLFR